MDRSIFKSKMVSEPIVAFQSKELFGEIPNEVMSEVSLDRLSKLVDSIFEMTSNASTPEEPWSSEPFLKKIDTLRTCIGALQIKVSH